MDSLKCAMELLPSNWRQACESYKACGLEEIRLRTGRKPTALLADGEHPFADEPVSEEILLRVLEKATGASIHTAAPALSEGYLNYRGLRIGVCGTAVMKERTFSGFRRISSLAIRIPRECREICKTEKEFLLREGFRNTLIIGRPGDGKTTALRELIRFFSDKGYRIGVSDERNELAAVDGSGPQFDLGRTSDVVTGVPKVEGAMMLLRGMNPQILAMDEISHEKDLDAIRQIVGCGVSLLVSAHGSDLAELKKRRGYRELLEQGVFSFLLRVERFGRDRRYDLNTIDV